MPLKNTTKAFIRSMPKDERVLGMILRDVNAMPITRAQQEAMTPEQIIEAVENWQPPPPPKPTEYVYEPVKVTVHLRRKCVTEERCSVTIDLPPSAVNLTDEDIAELAHGSDDANWETYDTIETESIGGEVEIGSGGSVEIAKRNIMFANSYGKEALNKVDDHWDVNQTKGEILAEAIKAEDTPDDISDGEALFHDSTEYIRDNGTTDDNNWLDSVLPADDDEE